MTSKERRETILSTSLFALYIFVFLLTELTVNTKGGSVLGESRVIALYSAGIVCTSLGYVGFYFSRRLVTNENARKLLTAVLAVAYMGCTLCFMFMAIPAAFIVSALLALLLFGYTGGFAHYVASLFLFGKGCTGKAVGTAVAVATGLQFIVQNLLVTDAALIISLILSVAGILCLAAWPLKDWMFENPLPYAARPPVTGKSLLLPVCIVAIMSLCFGLGDGLVTQLHASGMLSLTSWLRLLYALGVFAAGVVADLDDRRYLPLCTLCMLLLSSAMALFINAGNGSANNIYISAMYLFSGFYVMYLTVTFLDAAPMAEQPGLWAGMGRIVRGPFIALTAALSVTLQGVIGQQGIAIAGICLSLLVLILMLFGGELNVSNSKPVHEKNRISEFGGQYGLTPREAEVLAALLDSSATNKDVAGDLYISTRVLERYITSIYEKTGVDTRVGLINLYYGKNAVPGEDPPPKATAPVSPTAVQIKALPAERAAAAAERYALTKRESEMLDRIYTGKTNEAIASELGISENTVKFHLKNLMKKMSVSSRTDIRKRIDTL